MANTRRAHPRRGEAGRDRQRDRSRAIAGRCQRIPRGFVAHDGARSLDPRCGTTPLVAGRIAHDGIKDECREPNGGGGESEPPGRRTQIVRSLAGGREPTVALQLVVQEEPDFIRHLKVKQMSFPIHSVLFDLTRWSVHGNRHALEVVVAWHYSFASSRSDTSDGSSMKSS